jgi:methylthioribulose-1-phosphate dehydratase
LPQEFSTATTRLAALVRELSPRGWFPATSSNFSVRLPGAGEGGRDLAAVSVSGIHKDRLAAGDFLAVDLDGEVAYAPHGGRPSAEAVLHTSLYGLYDKSKVGVVLHSHSVAATAVSMQRLKDRELAFEGLEILKGFEGVTTHESKVVFPIFPNTQDIATLARDVRAYLVAHLDTRGYLIAGHGLYTWGKDVDEAKRHLEAFEFLLAYELARAGR